MNITKGTLIKLKTPYVIPIPDGSIILNIGTPGIVEAIGLYGCSIRFLVGDHLTIERHKIHINHLETDLDGQTRGRLMSCQTGENNVSGEI